MFGPSYKKARLLWRCFSALRLSALLCWLVCLPLQAQPTDAYDEYFKAATYRYLYGIVPDGDWRWLKAQAFQESKLDPNAVSPVGAAGIMQIMEFTAPEAGLSWADRFHAERSINAGAKYLRGTTRMWWPRPTRLDRLKLGWAGYNAGNGHILKAQLLCDGAIFWEQISPCLHQVTGHHANETQTYIRRIPKWYEQMTGGE